ncbi:hypothetical protein [Sporomusa malonica]|nr:hypothetical protein [Sporomusa malonica]
MAPSIDNLKQVVPYDIPERFDSLEVINNTEDFWPIGVLLPGVPNPA